MFKPVVAFRASQHHQTGGEGVAIHPFKAQWEAKYGNQYDLLDKVRKLLGKYDRRN